MSSCIKTRQGKKSSAPDSPDFLHLYRILKARFGPSGWWPGESPLEVAVGAVLTQNTAWVNVEKAIQTLKKHSMLDLGKLHAIDPGELASLIRASGYYNIKAKRLKNLVNAVADSSSGSMEAFFSQDLKSLRDILLGVNGIGKETADSICCYAAGKTIFVVDAYTKRILVRHGIIEGSSTYDEIQQLFQQNLPHDLTVYKDLHAYLVFIGKDFCRPAGLRCSSCPLEPWR